MAIIKSYSSGTLKLTDYLIASDLSTENVTRNFKVSEVVNTILAALGIGTVTSISTADSDFITIAGGPITTTGTLTASLSASGTPSTLTYLRGDGTWSQPGPTPTDITTITSGSVLTTDTASWNFTGTGVTASSTNNNVTIDIPGLLSSVDSVVDGVAIQATGTTTTNPSTGDVTVTNVGVTQLTAGNSVALSALKGDVTVSTTANAGTVITVNEGFGLDITNGNTNAIVDVDYAGLDNYIRSQPDEGQEDNWTDTSAENDFISFNQLTTGVVKTAKFNSIPNTALTSITSTIDTADNGKVKNIDTYTNVWKNKQVVTLTLSEYNSICPGVNCDNNTLYLILGQGTTYTVSLVYSGWTNVTLSSGGTAPASAYSVLTEVDDGSGFVTASSITGIAGINYTFRTTITAINGYTLVSGPSGNTTTGTITADATETQTITAVLDPPVSSCTIPLTIDTSGISGPSAGYYLVSVSPGYSQTTSCNQPVTFTVVYDVNTNYTGSFEYSKDNATWQSNGAFNFTNNGQPVTIYVRGNVSQSTADAQLTATISGITVNGSSDSISSLVSNVTYQSVQPNSSFGQTIQNLTAGQTYEWATPGYQLASVDSAGNTLVPITGDAITFPAMATYTMTNPPTYQTHTIAAGGSVTYQAPVPLQYRKLEATSVMNAAITSGTQYSLVNDVQTPAAASSGTYTYTTPSYQVNGGYFFNPSAPTVSMSPIGSNGTVTFNVTGGKSGSGTSSGDPLLENDPTITGTATVEAITVTVKVTYTTPSSSYNVTFTGGGSPQSYSVTGSGSQQNTSFQVTSSNAVGVTLSRSGNYWCSSVSYPACVVNTQGCGPTQWGCAATVPKNNGSWTAELNGVTTVFTETFFKGTVQISNRTVQFSSLSNGDVCEIIINEP